MPHSLTMTTFNVTAASDRTLQNLETAFFQIFHKFVCDPVCMDGYLSLYLSLSIYIYIYGWLVHVYQLNLLMH